MAGVVMTEGPLMAIMWLGVGISMIFVAIRTFVQYRKANRLFANDYFIFFALTMHLVAAILYQLAITPMYELVYVGMGVKAIMPGFPDRVSFFLKLQFTVDYFLWTTLWAVKFSLLFFFWRLFESVQSHMRIFWWVMCGVTASTWVVAAVLQAKACDPISDFFTLGTCVSKKDLFCSNLVFRFVVGTDIAGDILIMLIPFPLLRKLQISSNQKWILVSVFLLPIIPIIFAVLRLVIANATTGNVDPIAFQLYSMLENSLAIITSCLPSIRLFIVNSRNQTLETRPFYANSRITSAGIHSTKSRRPQNGSIPLETLVESQYGNVYEDTAGILVKRDYRVDLESTEELHPHALTR